MSPIAEAGDAAALVVGGASGLGAATATRLAEDGYRVTVADLAGPAAADHAASIGAVAVECDVRDADSVSRAVDVAAEDAPLRVAVVCAGIGHSERAAGHDPGSLQRTIDINLTGSLRVLAAAATRIGESDPDDDDGGRGVIILTSSVAAFDGQTGQIAYASSKAGIAGVVLPAARDLSSRGIRVCAIAPGTFETPLLADLPAKATAVLAEQVPFPRRIGRPAEFADLVAHIVETPLLNGEVIRLDGALRMPWR